MTRETSGIHYSGVGSIVRNPSLARNLKNLVDLLIDHVKARRRLLLNSRGSGV